MKKLAELYLILSLVTFSMLPSKSCGKSLGNKNKIAISENQDPECELSQNLLDEIKSYQGVAGRIIETVLSGEFKGRAYTEMAKFVDLFPSRLTGSEELERSIDYMIEKAKKDGIQDVIAEEFEVPHWVRGEERAEMIEPGKKRLNILGLFPTIATPAEGITAEVVVVHNYTELDEKKDLVPGKIVAFNPGWLGDYGATVGYRTGGAVAAAKYGAVAVLVESITPYSLDTPHTGGMDYDPNVTKIPAASITREDAEMLSRLNDEGEKIVVHLTLKDELLAPTKSKNAIASLPGRELDEIVVISGHIDAWDVGQGAQDDAGGIMITSETLALIHHLDLKPRRTMQVIFWVAEEQDLEGARAFMDRHIADMPKYVAAFEADIGTFVPLGYNFAGTPEAGCIVQEVLKLTQNISATYYARHPVVGSDLVYMIQEGGVPALSLLTANEKYFVYHHSPADTMMAQDSDELDLCTAFWAVTSYILADLSITLPRANVTESL